MLRWQTPDHERNGLMNILIKNGRIWDGEKFFRGDVLTDGKKISKIEENISCDADFIYDATKKTVSAGLIDAHIHIKGISSDDFGINADMSCIPFGVTTALDASGVLGNKSLLESFSVKAFTLVKADFKNGRADIQNAEKMLEKYKERAIGIKIYLPEADTISQIYEVCEFAEKHKLIIMVHTTDSKIPMREVLNALRKGDIFTHAYHGGKNNVEEDDFEGLKAAQSRGVIIDAGLAGNVHTDFRIFKNAVLNGAAPDIISTDITKLSAYKRGGIYGMTMCMSIARYLGMPESEIFRAVTSSPAKALKKESAGFLKVGGNADISVLNYTDNGFNLTDHSGNNVTSDNGYSCALTIADGEIIYRI